MSFTAVFTITLSLVILGCFYIVMNNFAYFADLAKEVLEIRVYLKEEADPITLQTEILKFSGVKDVKFVSKLDGAKWLEKNLGIKEIFVTEDNPLPDMINIKLAEDAKVKNLVRSINTLEGIEEVEYGKTFIEAMLVIVRIVWIVGISLLALIGLVVLYIIANTIKLTVIARRKEIEIMKLVGATDWFIRWPFLLEGIFLGLVSSVVTAVILSKFYVFIGQYIKQIAPFIPLVNAGELINQLVMIVIASGIIFGIIGSVFSIKKFLRV